MKTITLLFTMLVSLSFVANNDIKKDISLVKTNVGQKLDSCFFNSKKLYGTVQLVEFPNQADFKVQIVNSFPDLKVQFVESFPDKCGEWQIVEFNGDIKVYITENFPDFKIQPVISFPGLP